MIIGPTLQPQLSLHLPGAMPARTSTPTRAYRDRGPCPASEAWPILNAGKAVTKKVNELVRGQILRDNIKVNGKDMPQVVLVDRETTFEIPVENTGEIGWPFYLEVSVPSDPSVKTSGVKGKFLPVATYSEAECQPQDEKLAEPEQPMKSIIKYAVTPDEVGDLPLQFRLYRDFSKTTIMHEFSETLDVRASLPDPSPEPNPARTSKPSTTAEIRSLHIIPNRKNGMMWLNVFVKNYGETSKFGINGTATFKEKEFKDSYLVSHPGKLIYPVEGSPGIFQLTIPKYRLGEWEITIRLYDAEGNCGPTIDSKTVTLAVKRPAPTVAISPTPAPVPTPPPASPMDPPFLGDQEQLLTDFYNCMQRNLAFKAFIGTLTILGDVGNPPPGSVLDDWDQFVKYYSNLFRRDPAAEEAIREFLPVFCP